MKIICRHKIFRFILLIGLFLILPFYVFGAEVNVRVSHDNDDAEENLNNAWNKGDMILDSSDLEMTWDDYESKRQAIGIRFLNIAIPHGAVISDAYITFKAKDTETGATDLIIKGEDRDDAARFSDTDYDITGRPVTDAVVNWNNVDDWNDNVVYNTPDLASIIQEIISRVGWVSGNDMVFVITGSGQRRADSFDGSPDNAPELHVEFTEIPTPYIQVNKTLLDPSCYVGNNPIPDTFTITNTGTADLNYSLVSNKDWVSLSSSSGVLSVGATTSITVNYDASAKIPGFYDATLTIEDTGASPISPNSPVDINVTLDIQVPTVEVSVSANSDDAEESESGGMDLYSTDLELITEDTDQIIGIRFQNIAVPQGAMITRAYIEFDVDEDVNTNPTNLDIHAEAADNPGTFAQTTNNILQRTKTDQFIEWNNLTDWHTGEQHQTPDLSQVVQAIVGRSGWASGNAMVFTITGSGKRVAESYDGDGAPPLLHIEYIENGFSYISVDDNNIGAICYEGNNAAQGSFSVTNTGDAALTYTMALHTADGGDWIAVAGQDSTATLDPGASADHTITFTNTTLVPGNYNATITIIGTNTPNSPYEIDVVLTVLAPPEGSNCGNVPLYAENLVSPAIMVLLDVSSSMTRMMNVSSDVKPRTPDLKSIVQEIVNRDGWACENSMVFIITGTGQRTASSYDGNSGGAPLLHVVYTDGIDQEINIRVSQGKDDAEESSSGSVNTTGSSDLELVHDGSDQTIGIRFQNVSIPKNAIITNAYLEFEIDEAGSAVTNLTIHGQSHDNPSEFTESNYNISERTKTSASVDWTNVDPWEAGAQMSRIDIGKDVISELVKDRGISWGFGTWSGKTEHGYTSAIDYTKIHVGCRFNDDAQQTALQDAIAATVAHYGTPFDHSITAAKQYFSGNKPDQDGAGESYNIVDCQSKFLIDITDGLGNGTVADVAAETNALCDINVSPIAVGFGIDNAVQIEEMAKVSNIRGNAVADDALHALHEEKAGVGQPFLANNREELINTLSSITQTIKTLVFHGSAPAPTTSVDQGNLVILAKFNAGNWTGELEALKPDAVTGEWDNVLWRASEVLPASRNVYTIDPLNDSDVIDYSSLNLTHDNYFDSASDGYFCKPLGSFINSIPVIVGDPAFYYDFDGYGDFVPERSPMVYIGANDGALHAFSLETGEEMWSFVPLNFHEKLNRANEPEYNMCSEDYCYQTFVDGSPQVGDIYDGTAWKTILVCGEREGGDAYFALDVTYQKKEGQETDYTDAVKYLWQFRDTHSAYLLDGLDNDSDGSVDESDELEYDNQLGETWSDVSIDRIADGENNTLWGIFFGSGYSLDNQANKQAYVYGIAAKDKSPIWHKDGTHINRVKLSDTELLNDVASPVMTADFEGDYISDCFYVGNLYGTMFRVSNIGNGETPVISTVFDFNPSHSSPTLNPISSRATYAYGIQTDAEPNPIWIYYGTGIYQEQADKTTMNQQYFFGLKDNPAPSSCYVYPFTTGAANPSDPDVCGDLVELEAKYAAGNVMLADGSLEEREVRYIADTCADNQSWVIKLYNGQVDYNGPSNLLGSERVIQQPLVAGGVVFFTTYIPDPDICGGSGKTWLYAVDYNSGCAPNDAVFDLNGDGKFDENDRVIDPDNPENPYVVVAIPIEGGPGSKPVLGPDDTLFITTPVGGLKPIKVNIPGLKVKVMSWRNRNK
ncbi:PilC/PilY family type IV pilus protein [Desulfobacula sp.]|uniref:PilC/PilY family type IV pilus protein n=1 Tax=Desulfobacula sp. TaxID=2593537 RepID=UPI00262B9D2C|nr:PilC/PilY family type IV pilus protein [Desulfobacula sp.]